MGAFTTVVGCGICCATCCPCGFCLKLDKRTIQVWCVDGALSVPMPAVMGQAVPATVVAQPEIISVRCGGTCGQIIQVQPTGVGLVQFACPFCQAENQITYRPGNLSGSMSEVELPDWWRVKPSIGAFDLASIGNDETRLIQKLLDDTWKDVTTRDRGYGKCYKMQVIQVQQNCNPKLWMNYVNARRDIQSKMGGHQIHSCKTSEALGQSSAFGPLAKDCNEFYLFHGTKPSACESICKSDFMVKMAGANAGTLYGPGLYFGENSSKSDEYATDDPTGIYKGLYAMLLCRVTCGRMLYTDAVNPDVNDLVTKCTVSKQYDSVLGDREKARKTYREFIVFSNDQAYPAYIVLYKRIDRE